MSEQNSSAFPFGELTGGEGLDIDAIFGGAPDGAAPGRRRADFTPFHAVPPSLTPP